MKALSIRQPWAWLIVRPDLTDRLARARALDPQSIKTVENRTWETMYRGPLLVHASSTMTRADYDACCTFVASDERLRHLCNALPLPDQLEYGGIVGRTNLIACVRAHESPFFCGPFGWVFSDTKPLKFQPMKGSLGLFNVHDYKPE